MPTVNEELQDAAVSHAVDLTHYANGVVRRIIGLLNRVDSDLAARITVALEQATASAASLDRLEGLLQSVRELNAQAYQAIGRELTDELRGLVRYEADYQRELFQTAIPPQVVTQVGVAAVNVEQVTAAALARPFQGRLLREWASSIEADRMIRIRDQVRIGYVEQETISQIVRRIRGTRAEGYSDGIIEIDRRNAEAMVRTAISHTASVAREAFYEANTDLIEAEAWTATLDTRTSPGCRIRDGKRYTPVDHKPIGHSLPWAGGPGRLHWQCRSTATPVVKSWQALGLDIGDLPAGTRASMDGQVAEDTTFAAWIKRQSAARQDEVLGPSRGKLLRQGGLTLDKFYNNRGRFLTLEELRAKDSEAFRRAGL